SEALAGMNRPMSEFSKHHCERCLAVFAKDASERESAHRPAARHTIQFLLLETVLAMRLELLFWICVSRNFYLLTPTQWSPAALTLRHRPQKSFLALGMDGLAALEHRDKGLDLLFSPRFGFHIVGAKGQRETVLHTELRQHGPCFRLGIDRGLEIGGDLHVLAALVGAPPASVDLGGF